jgi:hypothetical protein
VVISVHEWFQKPNSHPRARAASANKNLTAAG